MSANPKNVPCVLIIRDGWGENPNADHDTFNAVKLAETPVADKLMRDFPNVLIATSGEDVGLLNGTMGNSEVGHQNIGAGRIVDQDAMRITRAIRDESFFQNEQFIKAFDHAKKTSGSLHLMGLVSDGRVHSDMDHLFALIDMAKKREFPGEKLFVHCFTDGRDTGPTSGLGFVKEVDEKLNEAGIGCISTICGRYWAMDRDHRWQRVQRAYEMLTRGKGEAFATPESAIRHAYDNPPEPTMQGDEFIPPSVIRNGEARDEQLISSGDSVIFFNFRGDRPRELSKAFVLSDADWKQVVNAGEKGGFDRGEKIEDLMFITMCAYEKGLPVDGVAFTKPPKMENIAGDWIASKGLTQFRCAETEKFPHVTFFFNDYREEPFEGERREIRQSPKDVSTYDQKPEMSALQVRNAVLERLEADDCEPFIVVNFANGDMVGHTGNLDAAIKACETVDQCVGAIVEKTLARGGSLIVTADHGNAEQMWNPDFDSPHTAHTTYDVPLIVVGEEFRGRSLRKGGRLADIVPTMLDMMGLDKPEQMTGESLLK